MSNVIVSTEAKVLKALTLLAELVEENPSTPLNSLLQKVIIQFDLSPKESEELTHHFSSN